MGRKDSMAPQSAARIELRFPRTPARGGVHAIRIPGTEPGRLQEVYYQNQSATCVPGWRTRRIPFCYSAGAFGYDLESYIHRVLEGVRRYRRERRGRKTDQGGVLHP